MLESQAIPGLKKKLTLAPMGLYPTGRSAIVVDDGLATGASAKAALAAVKRRGAARVVLAVPVAPVSVLAEMQGYADEIVCLIPAKRFFGVGFFYRDFHQLTDEETIGLLRQAWAERTDAVSSAPVGPSTRAVEIPPLGLQGDLCVPPAPRGDRVVRPRQRFQSAEPTECRCGAGLERPRLCHTADGSAD